MDTPVHCHNPECGKSLSVPAHFLGRKLRCRHCGHQFTVPGPAAVSAKPAETADFLPRPAAAGTAAGVQPASPPGPTDIPHQIGRFTIRVRLGEGAFGVVYRAYDPQLDREVALKVAKLEGGDAGQRLKRFQREAKAAANLRHPHLVPVFEYGHEGTLFFIAGAFIRGRTLQALLKEQKDKRTPPDLHRHARVVGQLAEGLAYAHAQGIVHRDVKPANVMLDERGDPLLMDFGLAARRHEAEKVTQAGAVLGTPSYMAPEQARGQDGAALPASDQYSLGVMLFELLTGRTPFEGSLEAVLFQHLETEPPPPRTFNANIPRDLETICLKCLEKDPGRRYGDCQALADDLRRWGEGEPIQARRVGVLERAGKWCRKNPLSAVLLAAVAASLVLGTAIAWAFALQAQDSADLAKTNEKTALKALEDVKTEKKKADAELLRAEWLVYAGKISLAQREWEANDAGAARDLLDACRWDFRGWEHDYLHTLVNSNQRTLRGHTSGVTSVAFSPDGKRLVSGSVDNTVKVWDTTSGQNTLTFKGHTGYVRCVAFSPDGKRLVSGSEDKTVKIWDATTGEDTLTLKGHTDLVLSVAFSPDGKRLASGSGDKTVKVWDATTGQNILSFKGHTGAVNSLAFSPDGKRLASASGGQTVKVWDATTGQNILSLKGHTGFVTSVAFSPDGKRLASASTMPDQTVKVWDATTGRNTLTLRGHTNAVTSVAFSPDGKHVASGSFDKTVKVWDATTGQDTLTLQGHTGAVSSVAFSPDGKRLASGSWDHMVKVWDGTTGQVTLTLQGHTGAVSSVAFSPDGKRLVSGSHDKTVKVWDATTGQETLTLQGHTGAVSSVAFSPDGKRLASASDMPDQTVKVWDATTGRNTLTLKAHTSGVLSVAFSPDGMRLASGSGDQRVKVWDGTTGQVTLTLQGHTGAVSSVAFSPDGKRLVSGSLDGTVKVWDATTGQDTLTLKGHTNYVWSVAFSPDGKRLASGSFDKTVKVWDATTGQNTLTLRGHTGWVYSVAFSPDGKRLASGSLDGTVKVWDATTGQNTLTLRGHAAAVISVAFSPDGKRLASGSADRTVKVWDATTKAPLHPNGRPRTP